MPSPSGLNNPSDQDQRSPQKHGSGLHPTEWGSRSPRHSKQSLALIRELPAPSPQFWKLGDSRHSRIPGAGQGRESCVCVRIPRQGGWGDWGSLQVPPARVCVCVGGGRAGILGILGLGKTPSAPTSTIPDPSFLGARPDPLHTEARKPKLTFTGGWEGMSCPLPLRLVLGWTRARSDPNPYGWCVCVLASAREVLDSVGGAGRSGGR